MDKPKTYKGLISTDWSECLSPNGPFDPLAFAFPQLRSELEKVFRNYTGNMIRLRDAISSIQEMIPSGLDRDKMDAYLEASFATYVGVPEFLQWCIENKILVMINTTGSQGYFQRAIYKGLIPPVPIIAANPLIQYPEHTDGNRYALEVTEIDDKAKNTEYVLRECDLEGEKLIVIGDSGGDGPHFVWASQQKAHLIASMAKQSLINYCSSRNVSIDRFFGVVYKPGESRKLKLEQEQNFMDLAPIVSDVLRLEN